MGKMKKKVHTDRISERKVIYLRAALNRHAMNSPGRPGSSCSISITKYITICGEHQEFLKHLLTIFQFSQNQSCGDLDHNGKLEKPAPVSLCFNVHQSGSSVQ